MIDTRAEEFALAEALAMCGSLSTPEKRTDCVGDLPANIRNAIDRRDDQISDLRNIVRSCVQYDDGIRSLLNVVEFREKDSKSMKLVAQRAAGLEAKLKAARSDGEAPPKTGVGGLSAGYALVIGVSRYEHGRDAHQDLTPKDFRNLSFAAQDARAIAAFLKGDAQYDVTALVDEGADRRSIMRALDGLRKRCRQSGVENPLVLVFFSGHGARDPEGRHYLVPHDGERDDLFSTALWSKTFDNALAELNTNSLVVFLDTCHAGAFGADGVKDGAFLQGDPQQLVGKERYVVASCMAGQQSRELHGHGIFTRHLLELLRCETEEFRDTEEVELWEVYTALKRMVQETVRRDCEGAVQVPDARLDRDTRIVLTVNQRAVFRRVERERRLQEAVRAQLKASGRSSYAPISKRLLEYVENREVQHALKDTDFYQFFSGALPYWRPGDTEIVIQLCKDLEAAYEAAMGSKAQPVRRDRYQRPGGVDKGASERLVAPLPGTPLERRQLASEDLAYVLENIDVEPQYSVGAARLKALLCQPDGVSKKEFAALLQSMHRDEDAALTRLVAEIGTRFAERWAVAFKQSPWMLSRDETGRLPRLVERLKAPTRTVDAWLADQLLPEARRVLAEHHGPAADALPLEAALSHSLNTLIGGPPIWDARRFEGITLRADTQRALTQDPGGEDLQRLNRLLLEDAYPDELPRKVRLQGPLNVRTGGAYA